MKTEDILPKNSDINHKILKLGKSYLDSVSEDQAMGAENIYLAK